MYHDKLGGVKGKSGRKGYAHELDGRKVFGVLFSRFMYWVENEDWDKVDEFLMKHGARMIPDKLITEHNVGGTLSDILDRVSILRKESEDKSSGVSESKTLK